MKISLVKFQSAVILSTASLATLAISPGLGYDPINLPKMIIVVTGASILLIPLLRNYLELLSSNSIFTLATLFFSLTMIIAFFTNSAPLSQQLWGVWGRSTGLLTYLSFIICMLSAALLTSQADTPAIRQTFERLSYFITFYTLMQAGDIDPINWSQKLMVATLGNLNFMSSFLGLASISLFARLVLEKLSTTAKFHYLIFVALNLFLIWLSGSIQGLGVFAIGICFTLAILIRIKRDFRQSLFFLLTVAPIGLLTFLGAAGIGPLSVLRQETVIYRRDYWVAGIRMTQDNWLNGVGIDSYGDYYEQYRDLAAVLRTGPQRVTNTAHNIFLDVSSGAGVIVLLAFMLIFLLTSLSALKLIKRGDFSATDSAMIGMFFGFIFFCLISINQIGVGIWGFVFIGAIQGSASRLRLGSPKGQSDLKNGKNKPARQIPSSTYMGLGMKIGSLFLGIGGLVISVIPSITDAQMLSAVKTRDFNSMLQVASKFSATTFHKSKYQTMLLDEGKTQEAYEFALEEFESNPRNDISLRIIASTDSAPKNLRIKALELLIERDPNNAEFLSYARNLLRSLE